MINSTSEVKRPEATFTSKLTSTQISTLWGGKTLHQIPSNGHDEVAKNALNLTPHKVDIPPSLSGKSVVLIHTSDNKQILVRTIDIAKILNVKKENVIPMAENQPKTLNDHMQTALNARKSLTRKSEKDVETALSKLPDKYKTQNTRVANVYTRVLNLQEKLEKPLTITDVLSSHEFSDIHNDIVEGPHGEFLLILSEHLSGNEKLGEVFLGDGSWTKYMGSVSLNTLDAVAIGIAKPISKMGEEKTAKQHGKEIGEELSLGIALKGGEFPYLLPYAMISHINKDGKKEVGRLAERAIGDLVKEDWANNFSPENEKNMKKAAVDLFRGLAIMSERGVIHRDIKPDNILIVEDPATKQKKAKIADWGFATTISQAREKNESVILGSLLYLSPNCFKGHIQDNKEMKNSVNNDLWAMGMTVYFSIMGKLPDFIDNIVSAADGEMREEAVNALIKTATEQNWDPPLTETDIENWPTEKIQNELMGFTPKEFDKQNIDKIQEKILNLTQEDIDSSYDARENSLLAAIKGCFTIDNPPSAAEIAALCEVNLNDKDAMVF